MRLGLRPLPYKPPIAPLDYPQHTLLPHIATFSPNV
nr:MAG TPA: hypothetical protein [Caudoviricetes sp.]